MENPEVICRETSNDLFVLLKSSAMVVYLDSVFPHLVQGLFIIFTFIALFTNIGVV